MNRTLKNMFIIVGLAVSFPMASQVAVSFSETVSNPMFNYWKYAHNWIKYPAVTIAGLYALKYVPGGQNILNFLFVSEPTESGHENEDFDEHEIW